MLPTGRRPLDRDLLPSNPLVTRVRSRRPSSPCTVRCHPSWQWVSPRVVVTRLSSPLALAFPESVLQLVHSPRGHTLQLALPPCRCLPRRVRLCIVPAPKSRRSPTQSHYRGPSQRSLSAPFAQDHPSSRCSTGSPFHCCRSEEHTSELQ